VIDSYGGKSLHEQSHGESFMSLVQHRFEPDGLYILDEPEAALSVRRQIELLRELYRHVAEKGSQIILATHSPVLMAIPGHSSIGWATMVLRRSRIRKPMRSVRWSISSWTLRKALQ
jgi:predicted ATPase